MFFFREMSMQSAIHRSRSLAHVLVNNKHHLFIYRLFFSRLVYFFSQKKNHYFPLLPLQLRFNFISFKRANIRASDNENETITKRYYIRNASDQTKKREEAI
jgi:hypothetical protein